MPTSLLRSKRFWHDNREPFGQDRAGDLYHLDPKVISRGTGHSAYMRIPVICGGVEVHDGDIVLGGCDGVVVIPREREDEVFEKTMAKFEKEKHIVEELLAGKTSLEIYGFDKLIDKLRAL